MVDVDEVLKQVISPEGRCCAHIIVNRCGGTRWTCVRPEGHEGSHAAVDMTLRYFDGEGASGKPAGRVSFRSRLLESDRRDYPAIAADAQGMIHRRERRGGGADAGIGGA